MPFLQKRSSLRSAESVIEHPRSCQELFRTRVIEHPIGHAKSSKGPRELTFFGGACMHYTGYSCISELYSIYFFAFLGWEPLARTGFLFDFAFALGLGSSFSCCSFSFFSSSGSSTGTNVLHICLDARTYICMRVRVSCACVCGMHVFMHMSVCMHARCVNKCMHAYVFVLH